MSLQKRKTFLQKIEKVVEEVKKVPWHSFTALQISTRLKTSEEGLSSDEANKRLSFYGANELPEGEKEPAWKLLLNQFKSPLMVIMVLAFGVSVFIGNMGEAIFIGIVMVSNALVGFYQEYKANSSISALRSMIRLRARVIRGGREQEILAKDVVPGDILVVYAGDKIVADCKILHATSLKVNEASLTGESKAIQKKVKKLKKETVVSDRSNMLFMGTTIEEGSAKAVVVETGSRTEYGDIVKMLKETPEDPTPLQKTIVSLSKIIGIFISVFVGVIVLEGYLKGVPMNEIFSSALALFVSAIPEGLLPAVTIVLAIGMRRILQHKGLVRRLASTETLGGVTIICTDKTGTLTEGNMTVKRLLSLEGDFVFSWNQKHLGKISDFNKFILETGTFTNDAFIEDPNVDLDHIVVRGRPTESALLKASFVSGIEKYDLNRDYAVLDTVFFSSQNKFSASLRVTPEGKNRLFVIGAPEKILSLSKSVLGADGKKKRMSDKKVKNLLEKMESHINSGHRLIATAYRDIKKTKYKNLEDEVKDLILTGFIVLTDPVRKDVASAFVSTRKAGIKTVIITGDHSATAVAVAKEIGLNISKEQILIGAEIEKMTDDEIFEKVPDILLYARVSPRHKLQIVSAYQRRGEVVAMFGDGVNDAPALKMADIGVAVSSEVDAVREVADLVLLDSGFKTIVGAVEQGRVIFKNIRRVFLYLIVQDFSQFFIFFISLLLGLPLPLVATQLFFINLVESGLPDIALTTENDRDGVMDEPPRAPGESVLNKQSFRWMISVFALSGITAMIFYYVSLSAVGDIETARTMVMLLMCMESLFLVFSVRSFHKPIIRKDIFSNKWITGAVLISLVMVFLAIYWAPLQSILYTVSLSAPQFMFAVVTNIILIGLIDEVKMRFFSVRA